MTIPSAATTFYLSIIIPVYNEVDSVERLASEIDTVMTELGGRYEVVFVDDGSIDGTSEVLDQMAQKNSQIRVVQFRRNFGKAAALNAGFERASGQIIFTMDADLQDDPAEIPNFLAKLHEGYDIVSGWKHIRHDPLDKTLPSKLFNTVVRRLSGVPLNDFNCGFKAYRAEALDGLSLYGELHRFIPILLHWDGFRIGEVPVNHRAREYGKSKYGISRLFKGALDFLGVMLNTRFATRPLHVFGSAGLIFGGIGAAVLAYLSLVWLAGAGPIGNRPLLFFGMLMVMTGFQFITIGLLGEFIQRQSARPKRVYTIRTLRNFEVPTASPDELIADLQRAAVRLQQGQARWQSQQSEPTPQTGTSISTQIKTPFTG
ncbi:MAG: glycosyltransferase family 2 protein [Pseudomonadota bacterium]